MATSGHLICVVSPFAMARSQGRPQLCSSAPFDRQGPISSTMAFEGLSCLSECPRTCIPQVLRGRDRHSFNSKEGIGSPSEKGDPLKLLTVPLLTGMRLVPPPYRHCGRPLKAVFHRNAGAVRPAPGRASHLLIGVAIPVYNHNRSRFNFTFEVLRIARR